MSDPRHTFDLEGSIGPGGLFARYLLARSFGDRKVMTLNDLRRPTRAALTNVDGIFNSHSIREQRDANSFSYGSSRGRQQADELVLSFTGTIDAGNPRALGYFRDGLLALCAPAIEPGFDQDDGTLTIMPLDLDGIDRRGGGLGIDYFYNFVTDPNYANGLFQWEVVNPISGSSYEIVTDFSITSEMGVEGNDVLKVSTGTFIGDQVIFVRPLGVQMPVSQGDYVTASCSIWIDESGPTSEFLNAIISISFYGASGDEIASLSGATIDIDNSGRATATYAAPYGAVAANMAVVIYNDSGTFPEGDVYVGGSCIVHSSTPVHSLQRGTPGTSTIDTNTSLGISLVHGLRRHNMAPPVSSWTPAGALSSSDSGRRLSSRYEYAGVSDFYDDAGMSDPASEMPRLILTSSSTFDVTLDSPKLPVEPGVTYSFSAGAMGVDPFDVRVVSLEVELHNKVSTISTQASSPVTLEVGEMTLATMSFTATDTVSYAVFRVRIDNSVTGRKYFVTDAMINVGAVAEFADGTMPSWEFVGSESEPPFYLRSQLVPVMPYVVEKVDFDVKVTETQQTTRNQRSFLLNARCRDPRIYEVERQTVDVIPESDAAETVFVSNPATAAFTVVDSDGTDSPHIYVDPVTGLTALKKTDLDGAAFAVITPTASIDAVGRASSVMANFRGSGAAFALGDYVCATTRIVDSSNILFAMIRANGKFTLGKMVGGIYNDNVAFTTLAGGYSSLYNKDFVIKSWLVDLGGVSTLHGTIEYDGVVIELSYILSGGERTIFNVAQGGGFEISESDSSTPGANPRPPRVAWYREMVFDAASIQEQSVVGGMVPTPFEVTFHGPVTSPAFIAPLSRVVLLTDVDLTVGQEFTVRSDGSVSGDGTVANVVTGSSIDDLVPYGLETFVFEGYGLDDDTTKMVVSWRRAR